MTTTTNHHQQISLITPWVNSIIIKKTSTIYIYQLRGELPVLFFSWYIDRSSSSSKGNEGKIMWVGCCCCFMRQLYIYSIYIYSPPKAKSPMGSSSSLSLSFTQSTIYIYIRLIFECFFLFLWWWWLFEVAIYFLQSFCSSFSRVGFQLVFLRSVFQFLILALRVFFFFILSLVVVQFRTYIELKLKIDI